MVDYVRSDEEQVERIKEWWDKNGTTLIVTVVLIVGGLIGWRQWQGHQSGQAEQASMQYQRVINALEQEASASRVEGLAENLLTDHPRSVYADYARLMLARLAVDADDFDAAAEHLAHVAANAKAAELVNTARIRLARVHLQRGDVSAARGVLDGRFPSAFQPTVLELRGDLARQDGDAHGARSAYRDAISAISDNSPGQRERIQMKLDDLESAS